MFLNQCIYNLYILLLGASGTSPSGTGQQLSGMQALAAAAAATQKIQTPKGVASTPSPSASPKMSTQTVRLATQDGTVLEGQLNPQTKQIVIKTAGMTLNPPSAHNVFTFVKTTQGNVTLTASVGIFKKASILIKLAISCTVTYNDVSIHSLGQYNQDLILQLQGLLQHQVL